LYRLGSERQTGGARPAPDFAARMLASEGHNLLAGIGVLLIVLMSFALAREGATGVVKERMDLMKDQQKQMKLIGDMAKGKTRFDAAKAGAAAKELGTTTKKIPELFPEGSGGHPSEALNAVWEEWDRFTGNAHDAEKAADTLAAALAASGQDWKAAFKTMTDTCKSCHESFRATDEDQHH
jgi:cytochrome c556